MSIFEDPSEDPDSAVSWESLEDNLDVEDLGPPFQRLSLEEFAASPLLDPFGAPLQVRTMDSRAAFSLVPLHPEQFMFPSSGFGLSVSPQRFLAVLRLAAFLEALHSLGFGFGIPPAA
jgi:hypothetical protein